MDTLFDFNAKVSQPLAERMRPKTLDDFVGQERIVGKGSILRRAILADRLGSCIFYGPPGCGKTTLANIIAETTGANFARLNTVSSGVADAKKVIEDAKRAQELYGTRTYLLLDECHRWNKAQSDSVLAAIEKGYIVFIGSTTENPYINMTRAIVSRCRVFEFERLSAEDVRRALERAIADKDNGLGNYDLSVDKAAVDHIIWAADGDLRNALNALELAVLTTPPSADGSIKIDLDTAQQSIQKKAMSIDESMYYDMLSAFCKSLRGSDSDAALYWAERLIQAGCDPLLIVRRTLVHSAEDVGMADPRALTVAAAGLTALEKLGMPEGKIPLYEAIIYVCEASKSPSVINALSRAEELVARSKDDTVPFDLRDTHYSGAPDTHYRYPHDYGGWVDQTYLPESLKDERLYVPSSNGEEKTLVRAKEIKKNKG